VPGESTKQGVLAFGRQTTKGTPLASPTFAIPKLGGGVADQTDLAELALTGPTLSRFGQYKQRAWGGGTVQFLAHPEALGLLIYEVMGAQAVSGAGPYIHTFTMADTIPNANPLTVWDMVGNNWMRFTDMWVNRLKFASESGNYVECEAEFLGLTYADVAAPTLPTLAPAEPRFKFIGSTTKAEADSATPATMTNITGVEIEIARDLQAQYGSAITPFDITPNNRIIDATLRIQYDSAQQGWDFYNWSATGQAATGGTASQLLPKGSFDITFGRHPVSSPRALQIASNGALWEYSVQRPEASPTGGPVEIEAIGQLVRHATGLTEVTVTLTNDTTAVY
jgi:hypothetical protein